MKPKTKAYFEKEIKSVIKQDTKGIKGKVNIEWIWFDRDITYPSGKKGTTGKLVVSAKGFKPKSFILTATYDRMYSDGVHWQIV